MSDLTQNRGEADLETRGARLVDQGVTVDSDVPPPEYHPSHGERDADIEHLGHTYPAVVTAHFPDRATAERALDQLGSYRFSREQAIQVFEKEPPDVRGDVNDPGLEPGEVAVIVQLDDAAQGEEIVSLFEGAGAKHARFYPEQRLGHV